MSGLDTSGLVELASRRRPRPRPTRQTLDLPHLQPGSYLAADPSLDGFGLVLIEVSEEHDTAVHIAQKFSVPKTTEHTGWEDILTRAEILSSRLEAFLEQWVNHTDWGKIRAVHEAPPIGHGKLINPEISLIASREFRRVTRFYPLLPMVRRQDHCRLVCGDANADKKIHHAALKMFFPAIRGSEIVTNEATRDGLSVALYAAQRGF